MNVIIVDDDAIVAMSMKTILEAQSDINVIATGNDGAEAVELYRKYKPDVLLTDIQMKNMSGLDAAKTIIEEYPDAKILLLTTFQDDEYVVEALKMGAKGYILKQDFESVPLAIRTVNLGQTVFGSEITSKMPTLMKQKNSRIYSQYGITDKEFEIIELVADGLSNREIAEKLYLGEGTVRNYISIVLEKMNLRDRTQLAVFYYKH